MSLPGSETSVWLHKCSEISFLLRGMDLLIVRSGVVMGLMRGKCVEQLTLPCTGAGTPFPAGTSLVGRRGTACCVSLHMSCKSCGRGHTGGCPHQHGSPRGSPAHKSCLPREEQSVLVPSMTQVSQTSSICSRLSAMGGGACRRDETVSLWAGGYPGAVR